MPWYRVFPELSLVIQPFKVFHFVMELEDLSTLSQKPTSAPFSEPVQSNSLFTIYFSDLF
jgi:hypothetical protein